MGRTKGTIGSSSPRGKSFGDGGKISTKTESLATKRKPITKKSK